MTVRLQEIHNRKSGTERLIKAYMTTINDFEIGLRNCYWWEFKKSKEYKKQTAYCEDKIEDLKNG